LGNIKVKIVKLEPMIVASAYAFSESPEEKAQQLLNTWAEPRGLLGDLKNHPIFGFDNPPPAGPGQKYGYEFWIKVDPKTEPGNDVRICFFRGGRYAVTRCTGAHKIPETWMALGEWCKTNNYKIGMHQGLEKYISGDNPENLVMDFYCPICD